MIRIPYTKLNLGIFAVWFGYLQFDFVSKLCVKYRLGL